MLRASTRTLPLTSNVASSAPACDRSCCGISDPFRPNVNTARQSNRLFVVCLPRCWRICCVASLVQDINRKVAASTTLASGGLHRAPGQICVHTRWYGGGAAARKCRVQGVSPTYAVHMRARPSAACWCTTSWLITVGRSFFKQRYPLASLYARTDTLRLRMSAGQYQLRTRPSLQTRTAAAQPCCSSWHAACSQV